MERCIKPAWLIFAMGIRDRPTAPRAPWQNGHTERLIGSIRRECLDHVVVFGERHLRHVLLSYKQYYKRRSHTLVSEQRRASAAGRSGGWAHSAGANSRRITPLLCSDLISDRDSYKRVIGEAFRSRENARRMCEVTISVKALNRMLELGRPICVRVA
jgi:transposase InsO family protein